MLPGTIIVNAMQRNCMERVLCGTAVQEVFAEWNSHFFGFAGSSTGIGLYYEGYSTVPTYIYIHLLCVMRGGV